MLQNIILYANVCLSLTHYNLYSSIHVNSFVSGCILFYFIIDLYEMYITTSISQLTHLTKWLFQLTCTCN